jgi:hypothetical protein
MWLVLRVTDKSRRFRPSRSSRCRTLRRRCPDRLSTDRLSAGSSRNRHRLGNVSQLLRCRPPLPFQAVHTFAAILTRTVERPLRTETHNVVAESRCRFNLDGDAGRQLARLLRYLVHQRVHGQGVPIPQPQIQIRIGQITVQILR